VSDAKEYLRLIKSTATEHRGPLRLFRDPKEAQPLQNLAPKVHAGVSQVDERTYRAASAWHAAAWMLDQATLIAQVANVDGSSGLRAMYQPKLGAPIFRGQRDPAWKLVASIFRSDSSPPHVVLALELFIDAMIELMDYQENPMNGRFVHMAGAQHYGGKSAAHDELPTPLLDFTPDPIVAIYFACLGADDSKQTEVVLYAMPLGVSGASGGRIILPPPWLRRLWLQRGVFVDCTTVSDVDLREVCVRILLPPSKEFVNWVLEQRGEALLPSDPWFEKAIAWAIGSAKSLVGATPSHPLGEWLRKECGDPPFRWYAIQPAAMAAHPNQLVDLCDWLALKVLNQKLTYDLNVLDLMLKDNEPLFRQQRAVWKLVQTLLPQDANRWLPLLQALEAITQSVQMKFSRKKP
ncbi:MAG TPA: FRG domain-containing protein, partial [Candidatus Udaeobacter sp.]